MLGKLKAKLRGIPALFYAYQYLRNNAELLPRRIKYRANFPEHRLSPEERAILQELRKEGIAVLPGFLDAEAVSAMKGAIDRAIAADEYYYAAGKFAFQEPSKNISEIGRLNVIDPTIHSPAFIKFALNDFIRRVVNAYLGVDSLLAGIAAYRTRPTTVHPKGAFHWHYDNAYLQVKAIAYLTDVGEEDGPFAYIPNSWKRRLVSATYEETRVADKDVPEGTYVNCVAKAGTVLLVDTQIIHRATPNLRGNRDVVSIIYDAATSIRQQAFYNLPIPTPDLKGLTKEQRRFLRVPPVPGQLD
jgi:ectoine hydroxylase-related dioxygenase (phytanoyl-CoA dioxygenase family)